MRRAAVLSLALWALHAAGCSHPGPAPRLEAPDERERGIPPSPGNGTAADLERAWRFDLPPPRLRAGDLRLRLWATYYYVPHARHSERGYALRDPSGRELGPRLGLRDWCEAAMQGTVFVATDDGPPLSLNFASAPPGRMEVDCTSIYPRHPAIGRSRFQPSVGPYGDGVQGLSIVPFRTIAVDSRVIPIGTVLYVPSARGTELTLPTGERRVHDGYFFAADRGGAIRDRHIDVFIGPADASPFAFVRSRSDATFAAYPIHSPEIAEIMRRAHRPAAAARTARVHD